MSFYILSKVVRVRRVTVFRYSIRAGLDGPIHVRKITFPRTDQGTDHHQLPQTRVGLQGHGEPPHKNVSFGIQFILQDSQRLEIEAPIQYDRKGMEVEFVVRSSFRISAAGSPVKPVGYKPIEVFDRWEFVEIVNIKGAHLVEGEFFEFWSVDGEFI